MKSQTIRKSSEILNFLFNQSLGCDQGFGVGMTELIQVDELISLPS